MRYTLRPVLVLLVFVTVAAAGCSRDPDVAKQEHFQRGEQYFSDGKYREAIIEYRNAVQLDARFGPARYKLAEAYVHVGDAQGAFREYVRAADLMDDAEVQLKAGNLLLLGGRYEDARARAEAVLAREPANALALVLRANSLAGLRDLDGAIKEMERAIVAEPNRGLSYASLGAFELLRGNRTEAEAAYAKALDAEPKSALTHMALGNYRLALGDRSGAEAAFANAVEAEPDNVAALRALASAYVTSQQWSKSADLLERIVLRHDDLATRFVLADVYVALGQLDRARQELQALTADADAFPSAKVRLAALDYGEGRPAEGHSHLDELLQQQPKHAQGLVLKGRFLLIDGKPDEAATQFERAVAADTRFAAGHYWLGEAHARRGRVAEAKKALGDAVHLDPTHVPAQVSLSRLHLRAGETDGALNFAEQAARLAPRYAEARRALVWALIGMKNVSRAQEELNAYANMFPESSDLHVLRGVISLTERDPASAEKAFARALKLQPDSHDALSGVVASRLASGNVPGARAEAEAAVAKAPADASKLVLAARTYRAAGQLDKAEEALRQAIQANPEELDAYSLLGQLYIAQRRLDEAIREFDELSKRQSSPVSAHTVVGILMQATNRPAEAKLRYEKALSIDPNAAVAANNLAWMQAEEGGNLDVALQLAQTAKARLPESPEVNDTLGYIYYQKGLYNSAIDALKVSVVRDPKNATYHYRLGMAHAKDGNATLARQSLDRALELSATFSGAAEARATLASLR